MRKWPVTLLNLGCSYILVAQTINYNILYQYPNMARNISLAPLYGGFDFGRKAFPTGATMFYTGHKFSGEVNYSLSLIKKDTAKSMAAISPFHEVDVVFALHLSDITENVPQKVSTGHSTDGLYNYESYFFVDVEARKIKAVRLGYSMFNSYLTTTVQDTMSGATSYSREYINYKTMVLFLGFLSKQVLNYVIDYGDLRVVKRMREFYIDFMFPISSSKDNTHLPQATINDIDIPAYHSWGGRVGWMHHSAKIVGSYVRVEAGWLPGWQQSGSSGSYYTMLELGFCFSAKAMKN